MKALKTMIMKCSHCHGIEKTFFQDQEMPLYPDNCIVSCICEFCFEPYQQSLSGDSERAAEGLKRYENRKDCWDGVARSSPEGGWTIDLGKVPLSEPDGSK